MTEQIRKHRNWRVYGGLLVMLLCVAGLLGSAAMAQVATANINGTVRDTSGAAIPNAQVQLTDVNNGVVRTTVTNGAGIYYFPTVTPGLYSMRASKTGFASVSQPPVTLQVGQTATFDFDLKIGTTSTTVTVTAAAPALETSTAELATVVSPKEVNDLPLNGRNFSELMLMLPGTVNLNTGQANDGFDGVSIGEYAAPTVNGASDKSNMYILDGLNDLNTYSGVYNYEPIVDDIQEFTSQGHNDLAQYGGAAGAMLSVVTKSGTDQYHGALWEYIRNSAFDAIGYFATTVAPLRQNQYGASGGGPLSIPKLYDGRKHHSYIYGAWETFAYRSAQTTGVLGPTAAERNGDFSGSGFTIYDPATTTLNPTTGEYSRQTFTEEYNEPNPKYCGGDINCIPSSRFNPISSLYQSILPATGALVNGSNYYATERSSQTQYSGTIRFDQYFGNNDQIMFRYSQYNLAESSPSDLTGIYSINQPGHNYIGHWTHEFNSSAVSDVYFGRNYGFIDTGTTQPLEPSNFVPELQADGMSPYWMNLTTIGATAPQFTASGYSEGFSGSQLQGTGLADDWQFGGSFTDVLGRHTIKAGVDFQTNNMVSPIAYNGVGFAPQQTASLGANSTGGDGWASLLLGIPGNATYRSIYEDVHGGWIDAAYIQDQFKATNRLTVNFGFRNDFVLTPIYGTGHGSNFYTGEANPLTGTYTLNALPPVCSATQFAPCIPDGIYTGPGSSAPGTGQLPAHTSVNPTLRMINNSLFDWGPRLGLAYRINNKTVFRAAYSRFYDAWGTIIQLSQNFGGNWPSVNAIDNTVLNPDVPTVTVADPLQLGTSGNIYPINNFSQVSQWMVDPNFKTPAYDQWNVGFQRQLPDNITLEADYVGSRGTHEDYGPAFNVPQPGPGNQTARRPFPYMQPQWFDESVGNSRYNALQVTAQTQSTHGVTFLVAYTLSRTTANGCALGASCDAQNPYVLSSSYGTSDLNQTNVFSAAFTAESPFDHSANKVVSNLAGGWALNAIIQVSSGQPYTVVAGNDPLNVGGINQERMNMVGNPNSGSGIHTQKEWFNTSAFTPPTNYVYGNEPVNPLVSQHWNDVDMSLFRNFQIGLGQQRYFQFRADAFNAFNNVVFSVPDTNDTDPTYGQVTGQHNAPRELQFALRFYY